MKPLNITFLSCLVLVGLTTACTENTINLKTETENNIEIPNGSGSEVLFDTEMAEHQLANTESKALLTSFLPHEWKEGNNEKQSQTRLVFEDFRKFGISNVMQWQGDERISIKQVRYNAQNRTYQRTSDFEYKTSSTNNRMSSLSQVGESGLRWIPQESPNDKYNFIAIYPKLHYNSGSSAYHADLEYEKGNIGGLEHTESVGGESGVKILFHTPYLQNCKMLSATETNQYTMPDMNQYYMAGQSGDVEYKSKINLKLKPILSTLVVQLINPTDSVLTISGLTLTLFKDGEIVNFPAKYSVKLNKDNNFERLEAVGDDTYKVNKTIKVRLVDSQGKPVSYKLSKNKNIILTAFIPPLDLVSASNYRITVAADFENLYTNTSVITSSTIALGHDVANTYIRFDVPPTTKIPAQMKIKNVNASDWMNELPGTTPIKNLSLPGSHMAHWAMTSDIGYNCINSNNQDVSLTDMLNSGVRLFDLRMMGTFFQSENFSWGSFDEEMDKDLVLTDDQRIPNNKRSAPGVFTRFLAAHPGETVFLILSRVARSSVGSQSSPGLNALRDFFVALSGGRGYTETKSFERDYVVPLRSDLTLADCRGKIVVAFRPDPGTNRDRVGENDLSSETNRRELWFIGYYPSNFAGIAQGWHPIYGNHYNKFSPKRENMYVSWNRLERGVKYWRTARIGLGVGYYDLGDDITETGADGEHVTKGFGYFRREGRRDRNRINDNNFHGNLRVLDYELMDRYNYRFNDDILNWRNFKLEVIKDFWESAAFDRTAKNDLFFTTIPYYVPSQEALVRYSDNMVDRFEYDVVGEKNPVNNTWWNINIVDKKQRLHDSLLEYLNKNMGRGRLGFVFVDFVPRTNQNYLNEEREGRNKLRQFLNAMMRNNYLTNVPM